MPSFLPNSCLEVLGSTFGTDPNRFKYCISGAAKEDGYLSRVYFVTADDGSKKKEVVVKVMTGSVLRVLSMLYYNEQYFYEKIKLDIDLFRKSYNQNMLDIFPECLSTYDTEEVKGLILQNVQSLGYNTIKNHQCWDDKHIRYLFEIYGQWHGLFFALKEKRPEKHSEICKSLQPAWFTVARSQEMYEILKNALTQASACLKDLELKSVFDMFIDISREEFIKATEYKGEHAIIVHGDAWVNNLMFQYSDTGDILDVRIIDFQTVAPGTPVWDLSYIVYSGSPDAILHRIDLYLRIYHRSLSESLRKFDCDVEKIYPYSELEKEWKTYDKFGYILSFVDIKSRSGGDEKVFGERTGDLIRHMFSNISRI